MSPCAGTRWWDLHYEIKTTNLGSNTFVSLGGDPGPPKPPYLQTRETEQSSSTNVQDQREEDTTLSKYGESFFDCRDIHHLGIEQSCTSLLIDGRCRDPYILKGRYCALTCNTCSDDPQN